MNTGSRIFSLYLAYSALDNPMSRENIHGPAKSPIVLETLSPDSANADAHWLMACSEAPAQTNMNANSQNTRFPASSPMLIPPPSSTRERMGTLAKTSALTAGTAAHKSASIRQFPTPATVKNRVDPRTTEAAPQQ